MNGPEHYAEAERLLGVADACEADLCPASDPLFPAGVSLIQTYRAAAQVHATLALAAATAQAAFDPEGRALVPEGGIIRVGWETVL